MGIKRRCILVDNLLVLQPPSNTPNGLRSRLKNLPSGRSLKVLLSGGVGADIRRFKVLSASATPRPFATDSWEVWKVLRTFIPGHVRGDLAPPFLEQDYPSAFGAANSTAPS